MASATQTISIVVGPGLQVLTSGLPDSYIGEAYSQQLAAVGGQAPYAWTVASGTLPAGLALSAAGLLAGTPTGPPGSVSVVIRVTDARG